jgi:hypothetical protein
MLYTHHCKYFVYSLSFYSQLGSGPGKNVKGMGTLNWDCFGPWSRPLPSLLLPPLLHTLHGAKRQGAAAFLPDSTKMYVFISFGLSTSISTNLTMILSTSKAFNIRAILSILLIILLTVARLR